MIKKFLIFIFVLALWLVPIGLSVWFFWIINDINVISETRDKTTYFDVDVFSKNPLKSSFQRIVGGSFNLDRYEFCIKNDFNPQEKNSEIDALFVDIEFIGKYKNYPKLSIPQKMEECIPIRIDDIITYTASIENCFIDVIKLTNPKVNRQTGSLEAEEVYISNKLIHPSRDINKEVTALDIPEDAKDFTVEGNCSKKNGITLEFKPDEKNLPVRAKISFWDRFTSTLIFLVGFWGFCFLLKEIWLFSKKQINNIRNKK